MIVSSLYHSLRITLTTLVLACVTLSAFGQNTHSSAVVPVAVSTALTVVRIPQEAVSIWVQSVDSTTPELTVNTTFPMNPASVMKLVTAFVTLDLLGPTYTWENRVAITGNISNGTLEGNLYLIGSGDPSLTYERLWKLLRQMRALTGIERIQGDIIIDASALTLPPHDPNAFDNRGLRPYNAGPYGLLVQHNTLQLTLVPNAQIGKPVAVISEPPLKNIVIDNQIKTGSGSCPIWYSQLDARFESDNRLILTGTLPASCGRRDWSAAPFTPEHYTQTLIATLWNDIGGVLNGTVRTGSAPPNATFVISDTSPPLADIIRDMNKWSNNLIARQLIATLGRTVTTDTQGSDMVQSGEQVARQQLTQAGIEIQGLTIDNGSGLSRIASIRADSLAHILLTAWSRPWMADFISSLPTAGVDGTARRRLSNSPAKGQAQIKTGTLNGVRAMAGYVLDRNGHRHIVVMIVNHPEAVNAQAAQDALLEWVWEGATEPTLPQNVPGPATPSIQ